MTTPFFKEVGNFAFADGDVQKLLQLPNGNVLIAYYYSIHVIDSALRQHLMTVGKNEPGYSDGLAMDARFDFITDLTLLPDGQVLVADSRNNCIRLLSADLQIVSTVAGDGIRGHQDGAAAQARFRYPHGLALLPDRRVLVTEEVNHCVRLLDANLKTVSTVAGNGIRDYQDGLAMQARFNRPRNLAVLPDGRVLVTDYGNQCIRAISADLSMVSTVPIELFDRPCQIVVANNLVLVVDGEPGVWIFDVGNRTKRKAFGDNPEFVSGRIKLSSMFQMHVGLSEKDSHVLRTCMLVANRRRISRFAYGDWIAVELAENNAQGRAFLW